MRYEPEILSLTQRVDEAIWAKDGDSIRPYHHRAIMNTLLPWLLEHAPAVVSNITETVTRADFGNGLYAAIVEVHYRVEVEQLGDLRVNEWTFLGGPLDGQTLPTDGPLEFRVPLYDRHGAVSGFDAINVTPIPMAVYERRRDYYRFKGIES